MADFSIYLKSKLLSIFIHKANGWWLVKKSKVWVAPQQQDVHGHQKQFDEKNF